VITTDGQCITIDDEDVKTDSVKLRIVYMRDGKEVTDYRPINVGSNIAIRCQCEQIVVNSTTADVHVTCEKAVANCAVKSTSGDVTMNFRKHGTVESVQTTSGDCHLSGCTVGSCSTVSGDINSN